MLSFDSFLTSYLLPLVISVEKRIEQSLVV